MPSEEDEMSLRRWHDLLRTELTIAFVELSQSRKDGADKRLQHYVECCAEQYWTIIARITSTMGKRRAGWFPVDFNDQSNGKMSSIRTLGERLMESAD